MQSRPHQPSPSPQPSSSSVCLGAVLIFLVTAAGFAADFEGAGFFVVAVLPSPLGKGLPVPPGLLPALAASHPAKSGSSSSAPNGVALVVLVVGLLVVVAVLGLARVVDEERDCDWGVSSAGMSQKLSPPAPSPSSMSPQASLSAPTASGSGK